MHYKLVFRIIAVVLLIIAFFMIFPIIFAFQFRELKIIPSFLIPMGIAAAVAVLVFIICRNPVRKVTARDGFFLVTASWIAASFIGALPFFLSGAIPDFTEAFFETMSGYTTTGASILTDIAALPKSLLFWRSLTHWLGGMGIVVLTAAILPLLGIGAYRIMKAEAPGPTFDKITPKITLTAKYFWAIYLFLTVAETVLLMAGGMNLFAHHLFASPA